MKLILEQKDIISLLEKAMNMVFDKERIKVSKNAKEEIEVELHEENINLFKTDLSEKKKVFEKEEEAVPMYCIEDNDTVEDLLDENEKLLGSGQEKLDIL